MTRYFVAPLLAVLIFAAVPAPQIFARQNPPEEITPPEEDESLLPEKLPFNPMEAQRSIRVGTYYMHKGKIRAALQRFKLATKYNPGSPDAFFKVGEAEEKLKDTDAAKIAFEKVIVLAPKTKLAEEAQKKLTKKS